MGKHYALGEVNPQDNQVERDNMTIAIENMFGNSSYGKEERSRLAM